MFDTEIKLDDRARTLKHIELMNSLSEWPLGYALPVYYATKQGKVTTNGTGVLIESNDELIGVTAFHCVTGYEESAQHDSNLEFYFGSYRIAPSQHTISRSKKLDLITLKFSKEAYPLITNTPNSSSAKLVVAIDDIYQDELQNDSLITFGGFPGSLLIPSFFEQKSSDCRI